MPQTRVTFLGTAAVLPGAYQDTISLLVNGRIMIDTGWYATLKMQQYGYDPLDVDYLIFTHCHHDHYMGLPALLFFRGMKDRWGSKRGPLRIIGPPDDLPIVVDLAERFLQKGRFDSVCVVPELSPLPPGETYESESFRLETIPALHQVTGCCYRLTDLATGIVIAGSGDTAPNPGLPALARDCDLLIHEASVAPDADLSKLAGHSRATDAARVAVEAGARRLRLVHLGPGHAERSLAAAREIYPEAMLAGEGETLVLDRGA